MRASEGGEGAGKRKARPVSPPAAENGPFFPLPLPGEIFPRRQLKKRPVGGTDRSSRGVSRELRSRNLALSESEDRLIYRPQESLPRSAKRRLQNFCSPASKDLNKSGRLGGCRLSSRGALSLPHRFSPNPPTSATEGSVLDRSCCYPVESETSAATRELRVVQRLTKSGTRVVRSAGVPRPDAV
jgi:hypothetical protein